MIQRYCFGNFKIGQVRVSFGVRFKVADNYQRFMNKIEGFKG